MRAARRILLAVLVGVAALEVVLQLLALAASLLPAGGAAAGGGAKVLCIGDSYTYGLGSTATDNSYPGVLQRLLRARDPGAPAVVNAGWPGQNSREALLRLDAQLDEHEPRLVCVLIGLNDTWTRPDAVGPDELAEGAEAGFTWRFRTWRLLALLWRDAPELPQAADPAPPPAADAQPSGGETNGSYATAARAVELVQAGRPRDAIALLERAAVEDPDNAPEYHQGLVQIHTSLGEREAAGESLRWLESRYRAEPSRPVAEALATALHSLGERERAAAIATAAVERFPGSSTLWWIASQFHYDTGELRAAERELEAAIATAGARNQQWIAGLHRDLARACCGRDLTKALRAMLAAMAIDRDVERCRLIVDGAPDAFGQQRIAASLAEIGPSAEQLELLQRLFGGGWADRSKVCEVLAEHLGEIVRRCRARGSAVLVLGYPLQVRDIEAVQRDVARAAGVPFVPVMPAFARELATVSRDTLYIRDGHCNDRGYALMAETAMPAVLEALK